MALVSLAQLLLYSAGCHARGVHANQLVCHYLYSQQDSYAGNLCGCFWLNDQSESARGHLFAAAAGAFN